MSKTRQHNHGTDNHVTAGAARAGQDTDREHGAPAPRAVGPGPGAEVAAPTAAGGGPLGSTQSNCTAHDETVDRRRVRFAARAALWEASTLYAVRTCGRNIRGDVRDPEMPGAVAERESVDVKRREVNGRPVAAYGGLTYCGNVWACPRCSAVVAMERSLQIARAVAECHRRGGQTHFLTLTLRHRRGDRLADLFEFLHAGWRQVAGSSAWAGATWETKKGKRTRLGDRDRFGVAGHVRIVESTVSRPETFGHGWHLHIHVLLFTVGSLTAGLRSDYMKVLGDLLGHPVDVDAEWIARTVLHCRVAERWHRGVTKAGGRVPGAAAVDLRTIDDGGAEYLGGYMAKSTYDVATRLGAEVAAGDLTKTAREVANVTPFGLLAELISDGPRFGIRTPRGWQVLIDGSFDEFELVDTKSGEMTRIRPPGAWRLWVEWEQSTKGRRQLAWAHGTKNPTSERETFWVHLLDARGEDAETEDAELAAKEIDGVVLGDIARSSWYSRLVWRPSLLVEALEAAEAGAATLRDWMAGHRIEYDPR